MLKSNLSTRPFYNERLVTLGLLLAAVVAVALSIFNVSQIMALSRERAEHKAVQTRDETEAARVRNEAAVLQKSVDAGTLKTLAGATREANALIDQRTFSWTVFFGFIEETLPFDVRMMDVAPRAERGAFRIAMNVNARRLADVETFIDALIGTGAFYDVTPTEQQRNDDGTFTATLISGYVPPVMPAKRDSASGGTVQR